MLKNIFKNISLSLFAVIGITFLTSCSVVMAAKREGTSVERVQSCHTRGQILSLGGIVINSDFSACGELIEVYQFQKEKGSAARAFMHGVLDVSTCGLWEVIGTPIEACDEKSFFSLRVYYDQYENVRKIELL